MAKFFFYDTDIVKLLLKQEQLAGGAAVQSYVWIRGLTAIGHKAYIATFGDQDNSLRPDVNQIELVPIFDKDKGLRKVRIIYYRIPSVFKALKKLRPDYLYQSIPSWDTFFIGIFCRFLKIRFIVRIANDNVLDRAFAEHYSKWNYKLLRQGLRLSNYVLCQNDYQYQQLKQRFPRTTRIKIYNPFLFEERKREDISNKRYIAWVAKIRYVKNLKLLYEIALRLTEEQFEIAGTYTRRDPETDHYLEKLKSLKNVNFRGLVQRDDLLDFMSKAKFLLNTSHFEGFSNTYLEAMSVGTPVLTTASANPDQIINKNSIGIVYRNSEDLQTRLNQLSAADYEQMSVRCIEYVKRNHDHIRLARELVRFLKAAKEEEKLTK